MTEGLTTALSTAMGQVQTDASAALGTALPYALGIAGIFIVIRLAWKVFKTMSK